MLDQSEASILEQWFSTSLALGPTFSHGHQAADPIYIHITPIVNILPIYLYKLQFALMYSQKYASS